MTEIREEMTFEWEFISPTHVDIEETSQGVAIIKGTLLAEGISRNGNLYTVEEMENIAKSAEDVPIYFGTMQKYDESIGLYKKNAHANVKENCIGKIMSTIFDKLSRKILFIAQIMNTEKFPNLIEEVKSGWGISIGGKAKGQFILDSFGRMLTKVKNMIVNHVQLIKPNVIRGQDVAQVESDPEPQEIQETMIFYELPKSDIKELNINIGGCSRVDIEEE